LTIKKSSDLSRYFLEPWLTDFVFALTFLRFIHMAVILGRKLRLHRIHNFYLNEVCYWIWELSSLWLTIYQLVSNSKWSIAQKSIKFVWKQVSTFFLHSKEIEKYKSTPSLLTDFTKENQSSFQQNLSPSQGNDWEIIRRWFNLCLSSSWEKGQPSSISMLNCLVLERKSLQCSLFYSILSFCE
jgi:hypothetical protein